MNFEIVTHGNFAMMRDIWIYTASILHDPQFKGLITGFFLLSVVLSAISGQLEAFLGSRFDSMSGWAKGAFIGIFFYSVFLSSNARVTIYDDTTGASYTQGNVPVGIAMVAGVTNKITVGLEDLVKKNLSVPSMPDSVGYVKGVNMLKNAFQGAAKAALSTQLDPQAWRSANYYGRDCVAVEAAHSSAYDATLEQTDSVINSWSKANNPNLYTTTSLGSDGKPLTSGPDDSVSCEDAWKRLNKYFGASGPWDKVVKRWCGMMLFDTSSTQSVQKCQDELGESVKDWVLGGRSMTAKVIFQNEFLNQEWNSFLLSFQSPSAMEAAAYERTSSGYAGGALMENEWMPAIKSLFFAIIVALTPLLLLLMITPMGIQAFKFMLGLFVLWGIWSTIDMMAYCMWLNRVNDVFQTITTGSQLGIRGAWQLWPLADKSLSLLGTMRGFGMLIASAICFGVFRLGGESIARVAAGLGNPGTAAGQIAGQSYLGPKTEGRVSDYTAAEKSYQFSSGYGAGVAVAGSPAGWMMPEAQSRTANAVAGVESYKQLEGAVGKGPVNVGKATGTANATRTAEGIGRSTGIGGAPGALRYGSFTEGQEINNEAAKMAVNAAAGEFLQTGRIQADTEKRIQGLASTPPGRRMLQKHLSGVEAANLSPAQAQRLNSLSRAAGMGSPFHAGDSARVSLGLTGDAEHPFTLSQASVGHGADRKDLNIRNLVLSNKAEQLNWASRLNKAGLPNAASWLLTQAAEGKPVHLMAYYGSNGKVAQASVEQGGAWRELDKGTVDTSTQAVAGSSRQDLNRGSFDKVPSLWVNYADKQGRASTMKLTDATVQETGGKVSVSGLDRYGNRRVLDAMLNQAPKNPGQFGSMIEKARRKDSPIMMEGASEQIFFNKGTASVHAGLDGQASLSTILRLGQNNGSAESLVKEFSNGVDAQAFSKQFASELPVKAQNSKVLAAQLSAQVPFLNKLGVPAPSLAGYDKDSTAFNLVQAISQKILTSDQSPYQKVRDLTALRSWVLSEQSKLVGGNSPDQLNPQAGRVTSGLAKGVGAVDKDVLGPGGQDPRSGNPDFYDEDATHVNPGITTEQPPDTFFKDADGKSGKD